MSHGDDQGSRFFAARRPSKWHILSYATNTLDQLAGFILFKITKSQDNTMIKTWEGLSDLKKKKMVKKDGYGLCNLYRKWYLSNE